ncbi:MAG: ribonuclease III [Anaerolineae bacterium]|nr:ribonuclease III [Anaerolineae bacterium]
MTPEQFAALNGLEFTEPELLLQALTHSSFVNENPESITGDNQRLEFLGDAVLGYLAGEFVYLNYPDKPEGDLTKLRAALVSAQALAAIAFECHVGEALRVGKGTEQQGARRQLNVLADTFEAVLGGLYLDQGLQAVSDFVVPKLQARLKAEADKIPAYNARGLLQERASIQLGLQPEYRIVAETGPEHDRIYSAEVLLEDQVIGAGNGRTKQAASAAAAKDALSQWEQWFPADS